LKVARKAEDTNNSSDGHPADFLEAFYYEIITEI
jgi:hypothetical protein